MTRYRKSADRLRDVWEYVSMHPAASLREIAAACGMKAYSNVAKKLEQLEAMGLVSRRYNQSRAITVNVPLRSCWRDKDGQIHINQG